MALWYTVLHQWFETFRVYCTKHRSQTPRSGGSISNKTKQEYVSLGLMPNSVKDESDASQLVKNKKMDCKSLCFPQRYKTFWTSRVPFDTRVFYGVREKKKSTQIVMFQKTDCFKGADMQNKNWTTFPNHTFRAPDVQLFPFRQE